MIRRLIAVTACLALAVGLASIHQKPQRFTTQPTKTDTNPVGWMSLPADEKQPDRFEPYLEKHPADFDRRTAALIWYSRRERHDERLKHHTFEMIKHHPESMHIYFANNALFFAEPEYREEVIASLERQLQRGHANADVYRNLALACKQGALPRTFKNESDRERFLRYYKLPDDIVLPSERNELLAEKALRYWRRAYDTAELESQPLYAQQLVELLIEIDQHQKASETAEEILTSVPALRKDASFLYSYGRSLKAIGQTDKARNVLAQVRQHDDEGFDNGPACLTMRAELMLGEMALERSDTETAVRHLKASLNVQRCCHNATQGVPLKLAERLLEKGKHTAVIDFCETALETFVPDQPETQSLLTRARENASK